MILTADKAEKLTKYLTDDIEKAKKLFSLPIADAVQIINLDGYDFTEDELKDYAEYIRQSLLSGTDEMVDEKLDDIFGGVNNGLSFVDLTCLSSVVVFCEWK